MGVTILFLLLALGMYLSTGTWIQEFGLNLRILGGIKVNQFTQIHLGIVTNHKKKHLCLSPLFNKVADLSPATLLKRTKTQAFSYVFVMISGVIEVD